MLTKQTAATTHAIAKLFIQTIQAVTKIKKYTFVILTNKSKRKSAK